MDFNELNFYAYNCFYCGLGIETPLKCPHCLHTCYCSEHHQKLDWQTHKFQCQPLLLSGKVCGESFNVANNQQAIEGEYCNTSSIGVSNYTITSSQHAWKGEPVITMHEKPPSILSKNLNNASNQSVLNGQYSNIMSHGGEDINSNSAYNQQAKEGEYRKTLSNSAANYTNANNQHVVKGLPGRTVLNPEHRKVASNCSKNFNDANSRQCMKNEYGKVTSHSGKNSKNANDQQVAKGELGKPTVNTEDSILKYDTRQCLTPLYELPKGVAKKSIIMKHADHIVENLNSIGHAVIDGLLGTVKTTLILSEVEKLLDSGVMKEGEVMQSGMEGVIRGDKVTWVTGDEPHCCNIKVVMNVVDHLMTYCKGRFKNAIKGRTQAMVACYPGDGVGYKCHIDNTQQDGRSITCIYYINKDWKSKEEGGLLRIYPDGNSEFTDIEPLFDRLIVFWSDKRSPHEVTSPFRQRFAITLWYFDEQEREEFKKKYISNLKQAFSAS